MTETITFKLLAPAGRRRPKPQRVRNPKRFGDLMLVLPPAVRKRAARRRARKEIRPHAMPRYFRGRRLAGVELFAKTPGFPQGHADQGDRAGQEEISIDTFALHAATPAGVVGDAELRATLEAIIYVTEEPVTAQQMAAALELPLPKVNEVLGVLEQEYAELHHGVSIRSVAGGYKMTTKPEYHEGVRRFVRLQKPPLKLSMAALETLAVVAYKQPITAPEILDIRGVQGAGVLKTLLDKKLITTAGRKNVVGRPMMYKTSREFLIQFGLNSIAELPTLKEFEELKNLALSEAEEIEKAEVGKPRYEKYAAEAAGIDEYAVRREVEALDEEAERRAAEENPGDEPEAASVSAGGATEEPEEEASPEDGELPGGKS